MMRCVHFDLETCCALQQRALFRHLNPKSGPSMVCLDTFHVKMCFAPQQCACFHVSSVQMPPHPLLERVYFSTFRSQETLEKHKARDSSAVLFCTFFSSLIFSLLTFLMAELPSNRAFSFVHIVGSFTSKLPSASISS